MSAMRRASAPADRLATGSSSATSDPFTRPSIAESDVVASRHRALRETLDVSADVSWAGEPHALAMARDVLERTAELADPVGPAHDERMERDRADERLPLGLGEHLVELIHDQISEFPRAVVVPDHSAGVVHLDRIRHRENGPRARLHPDRLVVHGPVHDVAIAGLLEEVERDATVGEPRAHPSHGPCALVLFDGPRDARDQRTLAVLGQVPLLLGVGDAVPEDLVAATSESGGDVRTVIVDGDVHLRLGREPERVEEIEHAPDADTIAVVAPAEDAVALRLVRWRDGRPFPDAETERLDVDRDVDGQPPASRPHVVRPRDNAGVAIAAMSWQHEWPPWRCDVVRRSRRDGALRTSRQQAEGRSMSWTD